MADPSASTLPSGADCASALARLQTMASDVRGAAVLAPDGSLLAATGDGEGWGRAARELLEAADAAAGEPVSQAHVGTEDGEVFAVRHRDLALVAAAERFPLASLLFSDIRAVLRDLSSGPVDPRAAAHGAGGR